MTSKKIAFCIHKNTFSSCGTDIQLRWPLLRFNHIQRIEFAEGDGFLNDMPGIGTLVGVKPKIILVRQLLAE